MNEQKPNNQNSWSMLDNIIKQAQTSSEQNTQNTPPSWVTPPSGSPESNPTPPKKIRDPMSTGLIIKFIGTLLLIATIFFGSFLAYVVFNPDQAGFFVTVFGINPSDVANILKKLINGIFGIIAAVVAIIWIISLFRAIWTPKTLKRKRLLNWLIAGILGIVFFCLLGFWAFLFNIIGQTDYTNPGWSVLIYDNDLYPHRETQGISRIDRFDNMLWPITLRYDISQNAEHVNRKNGVKIESYEINFDGAKCQNGTSEVNGSNPVLEQGIICTFDTQKNYNIRGSYTFSSATWERQRVNIPLEPVEIRGLLSIKNQKNKDGKTVTTIDASGVQNLGVPRWIYSTDESKIHQMNTINELQTSTPLIVYLKVQEIKDFDRAFLIQEESVNEAWGDIHYTRSESNSQQYTFTITGLTLDQDKIMGIDWILNEDTRICRDTTRDFCIYTFAGYGQSKIQANLKMADGSIVSIVRDIMIDAPIQLDRHVRVSTLDGKELNPQSTWDVKTSSYMINNIVPPETIVFDARDVLTQNIGYSLKWVEWKIFDGSSTTNKIGNRIELTVNKSTRHTVTAEYTFEKNIKTGRDDDIKQATDTIVIDLERRSLFPVIKLQQTSDYVPAKITVDGSESRSEFGEIVKFIYDFWEGKPETIGDAIQTYEYLTPGEKTITLTIINENNERAVTKKQVVLKSTPDTVGFTSSLSPGIVNMDVDFIANGTTGQIEDYIWNFGDNSNIWRGYEVTHQYTRAGTYKVTLTVKYTNWTEKTTFSEFTVVDSLE